MIALLLLSLTVPALAADIDGKWTGSVSGPNGDIPVAFTFKAEAEKLTGSMMGFDGTEMPIDNGKIDGNTVTFGVTLNFNGNSFSLAYKGVLSGEELKMASDFNGQSFEFVLKKTS